MAELGVAGSAVGVISLGIQVCQGLIQYYGSWKDASKNVSQTCKAVRSLEEILEVLNVTIKEKGVATQAETTIQNSINACTDSIEELRAELCNVQEVKGSSVWSKVHGQGRRLLYPFRESTLVKLKEIVAEIRENLSLAVDVLHLQVAANSEQQIEHVSAQIHDFVAFIHSHHNDNQSRAIIDWLSPINSFVTQNDTLRRRQDGTGEWIFEVSEFKAWLAGTDRILWCSGMPGAGKTILASVIIDKLQTQFSPQNIGLAFMYCNYKERDSQTFGNIIANLLQQLVQCHKSIPEEVHALYTKSCQRNIRPDEEEFFSVFQSVIAKFSRVYIVIDALDECKQHTRSKLIEKLLQLPVKLHLICTSRHLGDIQETFAEASHLEIRASDADITRYLEAQILQIPKLVKFCKRAEDLENSIIKKLVKKAKGMFLLAELHLQSLKTKTDIKSLRKALDVLPAERDQTYEDALERIQNQPKDESELAMRVLSWITHATRPLKVGEIQHAIAVMNLEPNENMLDEEGLTDEAELITACGGLASIDQDSRVIRLVHYTTEEYFDSNRERIFPRAHADIACSCIRYLSMDPFKDGPCTTDVGMKIRLETFKLLEYASHNWGIHIYKDTDSTIEERALRFLEDSCLISSAAQNLGLFGYNSSATRGQYYPREFVIPGIVVAAYLGLTGLVDSLLKRGSDIEGMGGNGWTALHSASRSGHEGIVHLLLEKGANIEAQISNRKTTLHLAAGNGHGGVLQLLPEKGADIKAKEIHGWTPLILAALNGQQGITKILLESGANINATTNSGNTALHIAAGGRAQGVVEILLENGANIQRKNAAGSTTLHFAAQYGYSVTVQVLLEKGADIETKTNNGKTALDLAAVRRDLEGEKIVQLLTFAAQKRKDELAQRLASISLNP